MVEQRKGYYKGVSLGTIMSILAGLGISVPGIIATWVLLQYRVEQLEQKLEKMEQYIEKHESSEDESHARIWNRMSTHTH